jgi:hypothetical protein
MRNYLAQVSLPNPNIVRNGGIIDPMDKNLTIGLIVSKALPVVIAIAGMYMLVQIILGGFTLMTAAGDQNAIKKGYGSVQFGIMGFLIVFGAYFAVVLVQALLGVQVF